MFDSYWSQVVLFGGVTVPFLVIPFAISLIDFITQARARYKKPLLVDLDAHDSNDFTILIPIFGDIKYLRNISLSHHTAIK